MLICQSLKKVKIKLQNIKKSLKQQSTFKCSKFSLFNKNSVFNTKITFDVIIHNKNFFSIFSIYWSLILLHTFCYTPNTNISTWKWKKLWMTYWRIIWAPSDFKVAAEIGYIMFIKNLSSSTSLLVLLYLTKFWKFTFFFYHTHLWFDFDKKKNMNANIKNEQIVHKMKYDLKGRSRSNNMTFLFKNPLFLQYIFCF